jgi:type I restriction enzyme S subunit
MQIKIKQITKPAVNQASFTKEDFFRIRVPLPPLEEQKRIVKGLLQMDLTLEETGNIQRSSKALQKSLINQIF